MLKQRLIAIGLIALSVWAIAADAGTVSLLTIPMGVYTLFTKKNLVDVE